jgi:hypothetical protein
MGGAQAIPVEMIDIWKQDMTISWKEKLEKIEMEVISIKFYWKYLNELLIGRNPKDRQDLLDASAHKFFSICLDAFYNQTLLVIARLCDPEKSCGKENLSIPNLIECLPSKSEWLQGEINSFNSVVKNLYDAVIQPIRHKKIAHNDLYVKLETASLELPKHGEIEALIKAMEKICSSISEELCDLQIDFQSAISSLGVTNQPDHFFNILRFGVEKLKATGY